MMIEIYCTITGNVRTSKGSNFQNKLIRTFSLSPKIGRSYKKEQSVIRAGGFLMEILTPCLYFVFQEHGLTAQDIEIPDMSLKAISE